MKDATYYKELAEKMAKRYGFEKNNIEYHTYINNKGERVIAENSVDIISDFISKDFSEINESFMYNYRDKIGQELFHHIRKNSINFLNTKIDKYLSSHTIMTKVTENEDFIDDSYSSTDDFLYFAA